MTTEIFVDIETIGTSRQDIIDRLAADVAPPANYKSEEAITKWWRESGDAKKLEAAAKTALDGTWGEVICIGFAINDGPVEVIGRALTEADLLNTWALTLQSQCVKTVRSGDMWEPAARWIGHNLQDFDLRFLWQRSRITGVRLPFGIPIGKPSYGRGPYVYDTMKEWAGWGNRVKQKDLELAFNLSRIDPLEMGGADVGAAYKEGRLDDIKEHCQQDIINLRNIYRRMVA